MVGLYQVSGLHYLFCPIIMSIKLKAQTIKLESLNSIEPLFSDGGSHFLHNYLGMISKFKKLKEWQTMQLLRLQLIASMLHSDYAKAW